MMYYDRRLPNEVLDLLRSSKPLAWLVPLVRTGLLSLAADPARLLGLVRQVEPATTDLVCIEDGSPVTFEWIGAEDYLGESRRRSRHRGRFCTSADALIVAQRPDGRTAILVEWKFTEMYDHPVSPKGSGGTDRREVYRPALEPQTVMPPIERACRSSLIGRERERCQSAE
jgi:hypothetical protein